MHNKIYYNIKLTYTEVKPCLVTSYEYDLCTGDGMDLFWKK